MPPRASSRPSRGAISKRSHTDTTAKSKRRRTTDGAPSSTAEGTSSFATTPPLSDNEDRHIHHNPLSQEHSSQGGGGTFRVSPGNSQNDGSNERKSFEWVTTQNSKCWKGWHQVHVVPYRRGSGDDVYPLMEGYPNTVGKFWSMKNTADGRKRILSLLKFYSFDGWRTWHEPEYPEEIGAVRTRPFPSLDAAAQTFPDRAHESLAMMLHLDYTRIAEHVEARRSSRGNLFPRSTVPQQQTTPSTASPKRRLEEPAVSVLTPRQEETKYVVKTENGTRVMSNMSMLNLQLENWEWQERRHKEKRTKALSKIKDQLHTFSPPNRPLSSGSKTSTMKQSMVKRGDRSSLPPPPSQRQLLEQNKEDEDEVLSGISRATTILRKEEKSQMELSNSQREEEDGDDEDDNEVGSTQILTDELPSQKNGLLPQSQVEPMQIEPSQGVAEMSSPLGTQGVFDPMNISGRYNKYRAKDPEEEVYESESTDADEEIVCPKR